MKDSKLFFQLLEQRGLRVVRQKKHLIWKRKEDGFTFVTPTTPSCHRTRQNLMRELKRAERTHQALRCEYPVTKMANVHAI